jgi:CBS-domain-containing membrane protein
MAGMTYTIIEILTSDEARWHGSPLYEAIVHAVAHEKSAARCIVTRGVAGCFENGEVASHRVMDISYNMPIKIEIVLPSPEVARVLPRVEEMVTDGLVMVQEREISLHRTGGSLLPRSVRVRDIMTASPVSVGPDAGLREIVQLLVRSEFDGVPVIDGKGRLLGMIGQEHLVQKTGLHATPGLFAAMAQGAPEAVPEAELFPSAAAGMTAREVMTSPGETIDADHLVVDAVRIMTKGNLKRLPVLDADKRLVGMLSRIDVLRLASAGFGRRRVLETHGAGVPGITPISEADLLDVPKVSAATPAREVLDAIDQEGRRAVVVDEAGRFIGVISDKDLLPLLDPKNKHKIDELTAGSLMRVIPTVVQSESVEEALRWMVEHRRQRLPVVDGEGMYIGMLSREELLRILAPEVSGP